MQQTNPLRWLWLGVTALAIAGIFAIILVAARTPQLAVFGDLFSVALVVHVDLSVLLWFLCIGGFGWSELALRHARPLPYWNSAGFYTLAAATALIALSPLDPHWEVLKSNYIPVLNNIVFLAGLGVLAAALAVMLLPLVPLMVKNWKGKSNEEMLFLGAAFTTLLALAAFAYSARLQPAGLPADIRFDQLFWAGGHILQFSFTLLMMAAWVALAEALGKPLRRRSVHLSCLVVMIAAMMAMAGFVKFPFDTSDFSYYQTRIMIEFGGIGPAILAVVVVRAFFSHSPLEGESKRASVLVGGTDLSARSTPHDSAAACGLASSAPPQGGSRAVLAYYSALVASLTLFFAGGFLGILITGQNVTIPAHYHGAIVGITLALMGYAYALLPRHGYASVAHTRLAFWQPIIYGIGQLMHIGGLAYSGGYGVLRKTPAGETPNLAPDVKAALGFMGLGGMLAIIGGLLFVVVMVRARRVKAATPV